MQQSGKMRDLRDMGKPGFFVTPGRGLWLTRLTYPGMFATGIAAIGLTLFYTRVHGARAIAHMHDKDEYEVRSSKQGRLHPPYRDLPPLAK